MTLGAGGGSRRRPALLSAGYPADVPIHTQFT
jgi:hypothetical protein